MYGFDQNKRRRLVLALMLWGRFGNARFYLVCDERWNAVGTNITMEYSQVSIIQERISTDASALFSRVASATKARRVSPKRRMGVSPPSAYYYWSQARAPRGATFDEWVSQILARRRQCKRQPVSQLMQ